MPLPSLVGSTLALLAFAPASGALQQGALPADPEAIVGGTTATTCQWPAVVSILEDDETPVMCTGSLVHPQVVMTAAHCITPERPIVAVGFGEHGQDTGEPVRVVATVECVGNPLYYNSTSADVGYCVLAEAVVGLPIVPLLAGCEDQEVGPGTEVVIVGYGATFGTYDADGNLETMGVGTKRWTTQTVDFVDAFFQEINLYGDSGSQSACFGDSGGPALVRLADGSWRVIGTGSHLYDPGGLPPPEQPNNYCGAGAAYGYVPYALEWLESASGFDLTPCWDGNVWVAGPGCSDFPLEPDVGIGAWNAGCVGGAVGGAQPPVCADVPGETDGSSSDDGATWGPGESTGDPGDDTTGRPPTGDGTGATGGPDPRPEPPPWATDTGSSDGSGDVGLDGEPLAGRGCTCTTSDDRRLAPLWLVAVMGLAGLGWRRGIDRRQRTAGRRGA